MFTDRLELRLPVEEDRARFVELFCDEEFMVFADGVLDDAGANARFDRMLQRAGEMPYAKQPIIERSSGTIVGYTGVDLFDFEGATRQEWGYRLVPEARGRGYVTEAATALMSIVEATFSGTIYAMIDPRNLPSQNVAHKLGFEFWQFCEVNGFEDNIYRKTFGPSR